MQTIGKYDPPRNRASYEIPAETAHLRNRWDAINLAEYYIWMAIKRWSPYSIADHAEREANKAKARYYLKLASKMR